MKVDLGGSFNGTAVNYTESFDVTSRSSSQISVNVNFASATYSDMLGAVIFTNGTLDTLTVNGTTIPASEGSFMIVGLFAGFITEIEFSDSLNNFTSALQFHSTGTSTVTIGTVSFPVTTYAANSLPVTVGYCGGSDTLTGFSLTEGTPSGAHVAIVTSMSIAGTGTAGSYSFSLKVVSLTVA